MLKKENNNIGGSMQNFIDNINQRNAALRRIIQEKEDALSKSPEGVLNITKSGNRVQYYFKEDASAVKKKYLKKSEWNLVEALCQKEYDQKVLLAAQKEQKQLDKLIKHYPERTYEHVYDELDSQSKKYVNPIVMPEEEYIANWEQVLYKKKGFGENVPEYYTDKGERVRSKTEILIANALNKYNVPYRYECPLYLQGYGWIHPDFMVLNVRLRKEFYWEHMGMMDDPDYLEDAFYRISMYEKNDIFPGTHLILTYETQKHPIHSKNIEKIILQYLK